MSRRPRAISKLERFAIWYMAVGSILGMALGYVEPVLVYSLFFFVPTGLCIFFRGWHLRRAQLIENDCRVCPHCLFSLVGLSDAGTCPECGNDYEMERVRGHWTREYPSLLAPRHQGDTDP